MSPILNLNDEYARIDAPDFRPGEYLYLGQVRTEDDETAVVAVAYKPDYARKSRGIAASPIASILEKEYP